MNKNIIDMDYGRVPPQACDYESAILGSLLLDKESHFIIDKIVPEVFYKECNAKIFSCIKDLHTSFKDIDLLTVTEGLRKVEQLDEVGGPYYITQLTANIASGAHIGTYVKIVIQKYIQREIIRQCTEFINDQYSDNEIDETLTKIFNLQKYIENTISGNISIHDIDTLIQMSVDQAAIRMMNRDKGILPGINIPFSKLQECIRGWQKDDLIYIAARPGMGKTALSLFFAKKAALKNFKVLFFSLEMSELAITDRIILGDSELDPDNWKTGNINEDSFNEIDSVHRIYTNKELYIIDKSSISVSEIMSICRKERPDIIFVDYIQLMKIERILGNRNLELGEISHRLKEIAKEFHIPVIAMAQLNRDVEKRGDKRPVLSDLRDSGELEQDADIVIMLYRNGFYDAEDKSNSIEIMIRKHRNGKVGNITVQHNKYINNFRDIDFEQTQEIPF